MVPCSYDRAEVERSYLHDVVVKFTFSANDLLFLVALGATHHEYHHHLGRVSTGPSEPRLLPLFDPTDG